jgi:YHS domain-containing protein
MTTLFEKDPVCDRLIDTRSAVWKSRCHGEQHLFCSLECYERFEVEPAEYSPLAEHGSMYSTVVPNFVS